MTAEIIQDTTILAPSIHILPRKTWSQWLIGHPLQTADAPHQTIGKTIGLAVFASDALSSTAYATQEIMIILAVAGSAALGYVVPISIAIVTLMAIVTISYEQTIHAYPGGGGAYIVARDNLGELPAQTAGAALLTDYILTVAVSISSGVAQITSAFPALEPDRVAIAVAMVIFIMVINLRGVKESGKAFALPTYFFVITMVLTVGIGLFRYLTGSLGTVVDPPASSMAGAIGALTPFLLLHAFSSGTSALTGIEAISNGITAFREPRSKNAGITLIWMSGILATLFLSISFLSGQNRRRAIRRRNGDLSIGPHRLWRAGYPIPGDHCRNGGHPDHGGQYRFCRFSSPGRAARRRRLSPAPVDLPRQPAGLFMGHRCPGGYWLHC